MNLPIIGSKIDYLINPGDYVKVEKTKKNRVVATGKFGDIKLSKTVYPTGRIVETKSYKM